MKKVISIIIAIMLVMSSSLAFASNGKSNNGNSKSKNKYYSKTDYSKELERLKDLFEKYFNDEDERDDILEDILDLKDEYDDDTTSIFINGVEYSMNDDNVVRYGNFQLPLRAITEGMGATANWNSSTKTLTITKGNITIVMKLDKKTVTINGIAVNNNILKNLKNNSTIEVIEFIAQVIGFEAEIDEDSNTVIVEDDDSTGINDSVTGKGLNQFDYRGKWVYAYKNGAFLDDIHYSNNKNAYFNVKFRGTQIKLYGMKASSYGIAAVSIDGGAEKLVDFYSKKSENNVLIYKSPVLSNGEHTLKVRVTGTKNRKSGNYPIVIDWVEVNDNGTTVSDTQAPTVPSSLVATAPTTSEVSLNWNASSDNVRVAGYKIYRNGYHVGTVTSGTSYRDTGLSAGTAYVYSVAAYDAAGNISNQSTYATVTTPATNESGTGLKGEYYNNIDFTDLKISRVDSTVNFDWNYNAPDSSMGTDTFSVRWTGQIQPLYSENYTFYTTSDDGVRLWVNGQKIIDNWTEHDARQDSGSIYLTAGQKYDIRLEYFDQGSEAEIRLYWSSQSQSKQIVAQSQLFPAATDTQVPTAPTGLTAAAASANKVILNWTASTDNTGIAGYKVYRNGNYLTSVTNGVTYTDSGLAAGTTYAYAVAAYDFAGNISNQSNYFTITTPSSNGNGTGLKGDYFNNIDLTDLKVTRVDNNVNFDWNSNSPHSTVDADTFSVRWTGQIQPLYSENYTFHTISDDGVRLWINGQKIIDRWIDQSSVENIGTIALVAGQKYDIKLEYYDNAGGALARMYWSSPSQPKQIVPQSQLYPAALDTQAPTVPSGLTAAATSTTQVVLNWTAATDNTGVTGYKIYRNGNPIANVTNGISYTDSVLRAGTSYVYAVSAYDSAGNMSAQSTPVVAITPLVNGSGSGLKGEYYNNMDLTSLKTVRIDNNVNFDWNGSSPVSGMEGNTFSVRWTGQVQPLYSEIYTFYTTSDDGVRLWVNGQKLIDNWTEHGSTENSGTITLVAGQKYDIKLEYFDSTGDSVIKLSWASTSQTKQIIPKSQLYPAEIDTAAPSVPTGLTAAAISASQINLNWTAATDNVGVAGYKVYRNGAQVGTVTSGTTYSDTGLTANTQYVYAVLSFDASGNSSAQCSPIVGTTLQQANINLALNKTVSSDSQEATNPAAMGNDGNVSTRWCAADGDANHWWKVDLGGLYNLNSTEVTWEFGKIYKYKVEVSQDDSNWTTVIDKTNNTSSQQTQTESFSTSNARYVRITVTGFESGSWASFYEFKVFGN